MVNTTFNGPYLGLALSDEAIFQKKGQKKDGLEGCQDYTLVASISFARNPQ